MEESTFYIIAILVTIILGFFIGSKYIVEAWESNVGIRGKLLSIGGVIFATLIFSGFIGTIISLIGIGIYSNFIDYTPLEKHVVYLEPITTDNNKSVYVSSGVYNNGFMNYTYYYNSKHGLKMDKVESTHVYIVKDDTRRPELVNIYKDFTQNSSIKLSRSSEPIGVIFYIPTNSIIKSSNSN